MRHLWNDALDVLIVSQTVSGQGDAVTVASPSLRTLVGGAASTEWIAGKTHALATPATLGAPASVTTSQAVACSSSDGEAVVCGSIEELVTCAWHYSKFTCILELPASSKCAAHAGTDETDDGTTSSEPSSPRGDGEASRLLLEVSGATTEEASRSNPDPNPNPNPGEWLDDRGGEPEPRHHRARRRRARPSARRREAHDLRGRRPREG